MDEPTRSGSKKHYSADRRPRSGTGEKKQKHPFNSTNNPTVGSVLNQRAAVDHAPLFSPLHSNANMQLSEGKVLQKKKIV